MQFQCIEAIFTPNDDVFVFIMPLHGCSFLPHQIVVDILVVSKPKPDGEKAGGPGSAGGYPALEAGGVQHLSVQHRALRPAHRLGYGREGYL